jgi:hypothetical protein
MPEGPGGEDLSRWVNVTVILRLVVDRTATLSHGEILDRSGAVKGRFADWADLVPSLRAVLQDHEK